jgi:hypothetical protein
LSSNNKVVFNIKKSGLYIKKALIILKQGEIMDTNSKELASKEWALENDKINTWMLTQGYNPDDVTMSDYIQKSDDCDWAF